MPHTPALSAITNGSRSGPAAESRTRTRAASTSATARPASERRTESRVPTRKATTQASGSPEPQRATQPKASTWTAITTVTSTAAASGLRRHHSSGRTAASQTGTSSHECESTRMSAPCALMFSTMR